METLKFTSHINVYNSIEELDKPDARLLLKAKEALASAYAPYSNFVVGAAVRLFGGRIVKGANQENASYPIGICAERVALFAAASQYPDLTVTAIAITAKSNTQQLTTPVSPCGACRQAILETEFRYQHPVRIIMHGETGPVYIVESVRTLLPISFDASFL